MTLIPPACTCQPAPETHGMALIRDHECIVHGSCPSGRHMMLCRLHGCPCPCHAAPTTNTADKVSGDS